MKTCKVRLAPKKEGDKGEVVTAEYHSPSSAVKGFHNVTAGGQHYIAACYKPDMITPGLVRFVGPAAVMRAMP